MKVIIMAAGKGTRLCTPENPLPKVLREADGKPLLAHVLDSVAFSDISDITVVTGYMHEAVEAAFPELNCVRQGDDAYGTGYAVMCGVSGGGLNNYDGDILILNGDMPLVSENTVLAMQEQHLRSGSACTLLSCVTEKPLPYGRIIRDGDRVLEVIEEAECTEEQKKIRELNVGLYLFKAEQLRYALSKMTNNNSKREYYLTDALGILFEAGFLLDAYITPCEDEMWGVNTYDDLAAITAIMKSRKSKV